MRPTLQNAVGTPASCTVVVCTKERVIELRRCLEKLLALRYSGLKIIVVENGVRMGSERVAAEIGAEYIFEPLANLSRARNLGARAARTELVAFVDDDGWPEPQWLEAAAPEFADGSVAVVTGPIFERDSVPQWMDLGPERFVVDRNSRDWFARANFGGVGHGGNLVFRRSVFESWSGFDERLGRGAPLSGGDESFAISELIAGGWKAVYVPEARVQHTPAVGEVARERRNAPAAMAYFLFLYAAAPAHRAALLRYILEGLSGRRRAWRHCRAPEPLPTTSRWRARLTGVSIFWRSWFGRRGAACGE
jgi:cellulose synthase/poly-beta-1,6-N-acetylglucosamine synthase-like glycosyltransferase